MMPTALLLSALVLSSAAWRVQGRCYGYAYTTAATSSAGFSYSLRLASDTKCPPGSLNFTRLYVQGACVSSRDNNFGHNNFPDCGGGAVLDNRNETCERVFASGPADAFLRVGGAGDVVDSGNVCGSGKTAYSFVKTDCANLTAKDLALRVDSYNEGWCFSELGRSFSKAVVIALTILVFLVIFCSCGALCFAVRKRKQRQAQPAMINMQPMGGLNNPYHSGGAPAHPYGAGNPYLSGPMR